MVKFLEIPSTDGVVLAADIEGDINQAEKAVLFVHGMTGHRNEAYGYFSRLAEGFAAEGLASVRADMRGHGDTYTPAGVFYTPSGLLRDIEAVRQMIHITNPAAEVYLFGLSMGGWGAIKSAAATPQAYAGLVVSGAVLDGPRVFFNSSKDSARDQHIASLRSGAVLTVDGLKETRLFYDEIERETAPLMTEAIKAFGKSTLIIQGDADDVCPPDVARHVAAASGSLYRELPGMGHLYVDKTDEADPERASPRDQASEANLNHITNAALSYFTKG